MRLSRSPRLFVAAATVLVLTSAGLARADVAKNYVVHDKGVGQQATAVVGEPLLVNYEVQADNLCNATPAHPVQLAVPAVSGVTVSPDHLEFTSCGTKQAFSFTVAAAATYEIPAVTWTGGDGDAITTAATAFVITGQSDGSGGTVSIDCAVTHPSAPVFDPAGSTTAWLKVKPAYAATSADTVTYKSAGGGWSSSAPELGEGTNTVTAKATDSNGCESPEASATYLVDTVVPTITGATSPVAPDGSNGWYRNAPTVTFTCDDLPVATASGVKSCLAVGGTGASRTLGESASAQSVSGTVEDNAGNTAGAQVDGLLVDLSDPTGIVITSQTVVGRGTTPTPPTCVATDAVSGIASCTVSGYDTSTLTSSRTLTATATDVAGRTSTKTATYAVNYGGVVTDCGIRQPILCGTVTLFSRGKTVPVKFGLAGDGAGTIFPNGFPEAGSWSLVANQSVCGKTAVFVPVPGATGVKMTGTTFRYDASADQYIHNAVVSSLPVGSCWQFTATLDSGQTLKSSVLQLQK